jgi:hypothetical protein
MAIREEAGADADAVRADRIIIAVHLKLPGKPVRPIWAFGDLTVAGLKIVIQDEEGIPVEQQQLAFAGTDLKDDTKLSALLSVPVGPGSRLGSSLLIFVTFRDPDHPGECADSGAKGSGKGMPQKGDPGYVSAFLRASAARERAWAPDPDDV